MTVDDGPTTGPVAPLALPEGRTPIGPIEYDTVSDLFWEKDAARPEYGWLLGHLYTQGLLEEGTLTERDVARRGHLMAAGPALFDALAAMLVGGDDAPARRLVEHLRELLERPLVSDREG